MYMGLFSTKNSGPTVAHKLGKGFKQLGPGLVTGAADDDPSGIATYSQAGAAFGYQMLWMTLFMLPMMIVIQEISGRIGLVTGRGLSRVIAEHYSRWLMYFAVLCLVFANVVNIGADIGGMAASAQLFIDVPFAWLTMFFTVAMVLIQIFMPYKRYSKILKYLSFSLLAYIITAFVVTQPWGDIVRYTLMPRIELSAPFILMVVAMLGTTISPYLFFWEPSQEVEEEIAHRRVGVNGGIPKINENQVRNFRRDNLIGMMFSNATAFFIIITAAATLHAKGITDIPNAAAAANALQPLVHSFPYSGQVAKALFAMGIIGTGLLAVPVLAGSSAYAISEVLGIKEGLFRRYKTARGFYLAIIITTLLGLMINFVNVDPMEALVYSAVVNGVLAVPLIFIIVRIGSNRRIMGKYVSGKLTTLIGWITFVAMFVAVLAMIFVK